MRVILAESSSLTPTLITASVAIGIFALTQFSLWWSERTKYLRQKLEELIEAILALQADSHIFGSGQRHLTPIQERREKLKTGMSRCTALQRLHFPSALSEIEELDKRIFTLSEYLDMEAILLSEIEKAAVESTIQEFDSPPGGHALSKARNDLLRNQELYRRACVSTSEAIIAVQLECYRLVDEFGRTNAILTRSPSGYLRRACRWLTAPNWWYLNECSCSQCANAATVTHKQPPTA